MTTNPTHARRPALRTFLRPFLRIGLAAAALAWLTPAAIAQSDTPRAQHVIHISVDGLRSDAITTLGPEGAPNFYRLRNEGAFTDNARTDFDSTETVPNHTTQITGRGVAGETGHGWDTNSTKPPEYTIHENKGSYVASVFDVVHDHGLRTLAGIAKPKLLIFKTSYSVDHGAPDTVGDDNGRRKIDRFHYISGAEELSDYVLRDARSDPPAYSFVHFREPDRAGHDHGWSLEAGSEYLNSVKVIDEQLGRYLDLIETDEDLRGHTTLILTADHGGVLGSKGHYTADNPQAYTIPFYVWGAGVTPGDLYDLNRGTRLDPGTSRPEYDAPTQPIRNGDASNLALDLLGLPAIPGSTINASQDLNIAKPASAASSPSPASRP